MELVETPELHLRDFLKCLIILVPIMYYLIKINILVMARLLILVSSFQLMSSL